MKDVFKIVTDHQITDHRCGARAGDQVRLKHDLHIRDHRNRRTGRAHAAGELWTILQGAAGEPLIVWLRSPDGESHTWNDGEEFLASFEIIPTSKPLLP